MGLDQTKNGAWDKLFLITQSLESRYAGHTVKEYTQEDLRRDLLASIPHRVKTNEST